MRPGPARPRAALALCAALLPCFLSTAAAQPDSTNGWGYPLDSLHADLARWRQHPLVRVDSIGLSVQGRPIWRVTVGEDPQRAKPRVFVHARTHAAEVQSFYVLREMLWYLTDTAAIDTNDRARAAALRDAYAFHFIPAYNPDGIALGRGRHNANGVDLEGNWNHPAPQPEVLALRATCDVLPAAPAEGRVRVALNLHSDQVNCSRFFFYHHENGTSPAFAALQRSYITGVRSYFPEGIEPWNYVVSWTGGFAPQYPESYWWSTRGADVMALTYEDTNCPGAGDFHRTARALLLGSDDYLRAHPVTLAARRRDAAAAPRDTRLGFGRDGVIRVLRNDGRGAGDGARDVRGRAAPDRSRRP